MRGVRTCVCVGINSCVCECARWATLAHDLIGLVFLYCICNKLKCKRVSHCACLSYVSCASYYNIIFLMIGYVSYLSYASYEKYVLDGSVQPVHFLCFLCLFCISCFICFYILLMFIMMSCGIWLVRRCMSYVVGLFQQSCISGKNSSKAAAKLFQQGSNKNS